MSPPSLVETALQFHFGPAARTQALTVKAGFGAPLLSPRQPVDTSRMVLFPCPECAAQVSSLAASCRCCGCPVSTAIALAADKPRRKSSPTKVGLVPSAILVLLATIGFTMLGRNPSPSYDRPQQTSTRHITAKNPISPSFDAHLAAKGKELHACLLAEANVHEFYLAGSLFAAVTQEPRAHDTRVRSIRGLRRGRSGAML